MFHGLYLWIDGCSLSIYQGLECIFQVYNKIDQITIEEVDRLARQPDSVVVR